MIQRAAIVGGSVAGLFVGLLLRRAGWDVNIYERASAALADRGAGIVTHPPLLDTLAAAGANWVGDVGVQVRDRLVLDRHGVAIAEKVLPQVLTSWSRLYGVLKRAFGDERYHFGCSAEFLELRSVRPVVHFSQGGIEEFDLVIAADGVNSRIRSQLMPNVLPRYAGYFAWRGVVDERELSPQARDKLCESFTFGLPPGEQIVGYPIASASHETHRGQRRFNFVWYRPAQEASTLRDLLTDRSGHCQGTSIAADRIRPDLIRQMRADAVDLLAPAFAEAIQKTRQPFIQPIVDLEVPSMVIGRVALIGDAAFVARPHVGMGVTKAAGDAAALVHAVTAGSDDLDKALAEFGSERQAYGVAVIRRARLLGAYMQAQQSNAEERAAAERYRTPDAVLSETAIDISLTEMIKTNCASSGARTTEMSVGEAIDAGTQ